MLAIAAGTVELARALAVVILNAVELIAACDR